MPPIGSPSGLAQNSVGALLSAASAGRPCASTGAPRLARQPRQDVLDIGLDIGEFLGLHHALEDIEAAAPIVLEDLGMDAAIGVEADRPAIAERHGADLPGAEISLHRGLFRAVIDGCRRERLVHGHVLFHPLGGA
ncbi:hypothetical protein [Dankookia sp. P2]|uniref:hypothetical protein n=1 Tax=Dankookia sp. P2 TaxID=3423955 RepID=UPI003D67ECA2